MNCDHGKRVWYVRGWNNLPSNRVGQNCIPCMLRDMRVDDDMPADREAYYNERSERMP